MKTLPMRFPRGTEPHTRESHDCERLSPITKYWPCGHLERLLGPDVAPVVLDVRLLQPPPVDVDERRAPPEPDLHLSPGSPMIRFTNVPPAPHFARACGGVSNTTTSPR